jgi:uncharacterized YigZ family protein
MFKYRTLLGEGMAELIIEKSKFIAFAVGVMSNGEADDFFARIRAEHKGATHVVPAFALGDRREMLWASDDGEPHGTAGAPILSLMEALDLTWAAVAVVRYFGGVKLGTGGLARAYTEAAKQAIDAAGIAVVEEATSLRYEIDYAFFDRIKNSPALTGEEISDITYLEKIAFTVTPTSENAGKIRALIESITSGSAKLLETNALDIKRRL